MRSDAEAEAQQSTRQRQILTVRSTEKKTTVGVVHFALREPVGLDELRTLTNGLELVEVSVTVPGFIDRTNLNATHEIDPRQPVDKDIENWKASVLQRLAQQRTEVQAEDLPAFDNVFARLESGDFPFIAAAVRGSYGAIGQTLLGSSKTYSVAVEQAEAPWPPDDATNAAVAAACNRGSK